MPVPSVDFEFYQPFMPQDGIGNKVALLQVFQDGKRLMLETDTELFCEFTDPAQPFTRIDDIADAVYPAV